MSSVSAQDIDDALDGFDQNEHDCGKFTNRPQAGGGGLG